MKIIIIDPHYSAFLNSFYKKYPDAQNKDYQTQKKLIFEECFGTADFFSKNLAKLGHEVEDIIPNNEILQKKWAKENGVKYPKSYFKNIPKLRTWFKSNWENKILEEQIKKFQPDIIYCQNLTSPNDDFLARIKKYTKMIVGQVACPTDFNKYKLRNFDLILTSFPHFVQKFKDLGINSEYLRIGFEKSILEKLKKSEKQYNAVFVGGMSRNHIKFLDTFEYLAENTEIDFWGYGLKNTSPDSPIRKRHHGEAWGIDMYNILYNSKISINRHINAAENNANNMRMYESTGVGTMLITDHKDNISEFFEVGKEIETYKSKEELLEKVKYYLSHEEEREKIAKAGQERTLKDHTYEKRMIELVGILERYL